VVLKSGFWFLCVFAAGNFVVPSTADRDSTTILVRDIAASGRCAELSQDPDERVSRLPAVAPGLPPIVSFRYYEGKLRHRFEGTDLMLDDAGH
jgi:hypothetical protein